ncbi:MAG: hypothetical protein IT305_32370 [Chloroflexi bacterium]|nr:hypothetical protein [Chloroflexota bacterium]
MADTRTQNEVEDWVRRNWMPEQFGQQFHRDRLQLSSGGVFDFDAVSADGRIVALISTASGRTSGGKYPVGKVHKLRSDMLFLTMITAEQRLIVLTEPDMHALCIKEMEGRRVPDGVVFVLATLPPDLASKLRDARELASREVRPGPRQ